MNLNQRFDNIDLMILKMVGDNSSIREMAGAVGRGPTSVHNRLGNLQNAGLVNSQPQKHRARNLTDQGKVILTANGISLPE
jgi:predicted transcriptional regulator